MGKDNFHLDTPAFDIDAKRYIYRVYDRDKKLVSLLLEEKANKNVGKFIKRSKVSQLSFATRNPQKHCIEIITFNIPKEKIAYKGIFHKKSDRPNKVFTSNEEGKWKVLDNISTEILNEMQHQRTFLKAFTLKISTEMELLF